MAIRCLVRPRRQIATTSSASVKVDALDRDPYAKQLGLERRRAAHDGRAS
jgi:hypothetical protein